MQALAEEGYIENDVADCLRDMTTLRNALVHGDFSVNVSAEQVGVLLNEVRAIGANIFSVVSG
ncbi:HepT-like ribonuclease domain-containing protein [Rhodopila sp.]|uniref:HepT-like ribonuclease domain-containing protein n=1 Tax=Rhodopila sp. TaxID=2480087 RepID=UPI003D1337C4